MTSVPAAMRQKSSAPQRPLTKLNRFYNVVNQFQSDLGSLNRFYNVKESETRCQRLIQFYDNWHAGLTEQDNKLNSQLSKFDSLTIQETETAERLLQLVKKDRSRLTRDLAVARQLQEQHPFTSQIIALVEARQRIEPIDARATAKAISGLTVALQEATEQWKTKPQQHALSATQTSKALVSLKSHFAEWYRFSDGYNPTFSWWIKRPYKDCDREFDKLLVAIKSAPVARLAKTNPAAAPQTQQPPNQPTAPNASTTKIDIAALISQPDLILPNLITEFRKAKTSARRPNRYSGNDGTTTPQTKRRKLFNEWQARLTQIHFAQLQPSDQADYLLLQNDISYELAKLALPQRNIEIEWTLPEDPRSMSGFPVGAEALQVELDHEMIRYTPEQLVIIAEKELQWCRRELIKASNEMGLGDDFRAAIENVKKMHVEPGQQPAMIKGLALDAINYLKKADRLSIPPVAEETWRMTMMSPERQLVNPFFLGGEVIQVSYPTDTMKHQDKLESMRGNNIPFARATVHHELIPGHHLQIFCSQRNKSYRQAFGTPFWMEGWALYWEMMLYEAGFPKTAEDRIGFLVWRSHRCARIVFSLNFHLGKMSPPECVDLLVNWVGFDRNNAAAEVRRSVSRAYSPLYQAAYMLGGLQIRQLRTELVDTGKMTEKQFHDAILQENSIPISLLRAILSKQPLSADQNFQWQFYGKVAPNK
ncbi:MAG: DUF885 family protein [Fuerstiella sp.]